MKQLPWAARHKPATWHAPRSSPSDTQASWQFQSWDKLNQTLRPWLCHRRQAIAIQPSSHQILNQEAINRSRIKSLFINDLAVAPRQGTSLFTIGQCDNDDIYIYMVARGRALLPNLAAQNLVPTLCQGGGSDLVLGHGGLTLCQGGGAKPCARYLCEELAPGTFAGILIKLHHSATVCKSSTRMEILRHVFEARYYQVL